MAQYVITAFYCYTNLEDPQLEVKRHREFLKDLDVRARTYISYNGINGQMSFLAEHAPLYIDWLKSDPRYESLSLKTDPYHEHVFPRVTIKFRPQLVALDCLPDLANRGEHVSPEQWAKMLEQRGEDTIVIDVRNDYESEIGHFEGAIRPKLKTFRQFPAYAQALAESNNPKKTKVMMCCTGGIRCETYSALLKEKGFDEVFQLEGGIINYGHKMGNKHWKGKLFVFDDRLSVPISEDEHELISQCHCCGAPTDAYYNCANMDCNELFLSCPSCAEKAQGCCSEGCKGAKRVRPFEKMDRPKPFRKWYNYSETKEIDECCGCQS